MKALEIKKLLGEGGLEKYSGLYADTKAQAKRFAEAIDSFTALYGDEDDIAIFSVPFIFRIILISSGGRCFPSAMISASISS